jgi:hypothetical protein
MSASNFAVTIGDTPTLVLASESIHRPIYLQIMGNQTIYLGDNVSVTTANGFPIAKHAAPLDFKFEPGTALYAVCAAGQTEDLRVFALRD